MRRIDKYYTHDASRSKNWVAWNHEEIKFLTENHTKMKDLELAERLQRTPSSVWNKKNKLKLIVPKIEFKSQRIKRLSRLRAAVMMNRTIARMKVLIWIIERCSTQIQKDKYIPELKRLSCL